MNTNFIINSVYSSHILIFMGQIMYILSFIFSLARGILQLCMCLHVCLYVLVCVHVCVYVCLCVCMCTSTRQLVFGQEVDMCVWKPPESLGIVLQLTSTIFFNLIIHCLKRHHAGQPNQQYQRSSYFCHSVLGLHYKFPSFLYKKYGDQIDTAIYLVQFQPYILVLMISISMSLNLQFRNLLSICFANVYKQLHMDTCISVFICFKDYTHKHLSLHMHYAYTYIYIKFCIYYFYL